MLIPSSIVQCSFCFRVKKKKQNKTDEALVPRIVLSSEVLHRFMPSIYPLVPQS